MLEKTHLLDEHRLEGGLSELAIKTRKFLQDEEITWREIANRGYQLSIHPSFRVQGVFFRWLGQTFIAAKLTRDGFYPVWSDETVAVRKARFIEMRSLGNLRSGVIYTLRTTCLVENGVCGHCSLRELDDKRNLICLDLPVVGKDEV